MLRSALSIVCLVMVLNLVNPNPTRGKCSSANGVNPGNNTSTLLKCQEGYWGKYCHLRDECYYNGNKKGYLGSIAQTMSGKRCMNWSLQQPHSHHFVASDFPDGNHDNNYCRSPPEEYAPGLHNAPWCYTTDPGKRWWYCDVKDCACPLGYHGLNCDIKATETTAAPQPKCPDGQYGLTCDIKACPADKESKLDLIIYIDGQRYIKSHFKQEVDFVYDFVRNYEIGKTRIGVWQFGTNGHQLYYASGIGFTMAITTDHILKQLDSFKTYGRHSGEIEAFYMLQNAVSESFSAEYGGRPDAKHVLMILTGGKSQNPTIAKNLARELHKTDIKTVVLEVGDDIDDDVIQAIAGENNENIFKMDDSKASEKIRKLLQSWTCEQ